MKVGFGSWAAVRHNAWMLQHCLSKQTLCLRDCGASSCQRRTSGAGIMANRGASALQLWRYRSSQTSSMRQLLIMLLTIIVQPFTVGCQQ
jgi:hypothetical protein